MDYDWGSYDESDAAELMSTSFLTNPRPGSDHATSDHGNGHQARHSPICKIETDSGPGDQTGKHRSGGSPTLSAIQSSASIESAISYSRQILPGSHNDQAQSVLSDNLRPLPGLPSLYSAPDNAGSFSFSDVFGSVQGHRSELDLQHSAVGESEAPGRDVVESESDTGVTPRVTARNHAQPLAKLLRTDASRDLTVDKQTSHISGSYTCKTASHSESVNLEDQGPMGRYTGIENEMAPPVLGEDSTQPPATQEVPQLVHHNGGTGLTPAEELDIICFLRPVTESAFEVVKNIAQDTPQHYFRSQGLSRKQRQVVEVYEVENAQATTNTPVDKLSQATPELNATQESSAPGEIALRLSSPVKDLDMGFCFGRDPRKSDVVISVAVSQTVRVSGLHFRIFINDNGMIMVEDTSTNGTIVDNILLKLKKPTPGDSVRRIIANNSMIELFVDDSRKTARFAISIPPRRDENAWRTRLQGYLAEVRRVRALKLNALNNLVGVVTQPGEEADGYEGSAESEDRGDSTLFTAGTMPYNHGMRWTGGDTYKVVGKLGSGAFATVYKLINVHNGEFVAAKEIEKRRFMKNNILDMKFQTELDIMKRTHHPHIIHCFDHLDQPRDLYILMEFVPFGDLGQHISSAAKLSDHDLRLVAKQMCQALAYLHDNGIAHRDIKPENILKKQLSPLWVKLADFGLSKVVSQGDNTVYQTFCGTMLYCAPEIYPGYAAKRRGEQVGRKPKTDPYSVAVDIWSLAAVMFHLVCNVPPYEASAANYGVHMLEAILKERFPQQKYEAAAVSPDWETFFLNSLQQSSVERWSARRLLKLSFMQKIPDVTPILHRFKQPESIFANDEESSEDGDSDSMIDNDLDASQLSISDAPRSGEDADGDSFMSGSEQVPESRTGLGIEGLDGSYDDSVHSRLQAEETSRYNLRARNGTSRQIPPQTPRKKRNARPTATVMTPAIAQQAGRLFGEVGDSGVFGSAANAPRIINQQQSEATETIPKRKFPDVSSQADEIAAGIYSPAARRTYLRGTDSTTSLRGAVGQIDNLRMASPELDHPADADSSTSQRESVRLKHILIDGDLAADASAKRSKTAESIRRVSGSSLINEVQQERPFTPEAPSELTLSNQETPRARKPGVKSLTLSSEATSAKQHAALSNSHPVPDTAMAQGFPTTAAPASASAVDASASLAQTMAPPPRRQSNNSSRPPTPVMQTDPENPLVPALGVLSPGRSSIEADPVYITLAKSEWGRSPDCTHVFPHPQDVRVSKSAFTIMLWDPATGRKAEKNADFDWTKSNFYAVISTRCSGHIRINGVPMGRRRSMGEKAQLGVLRTGDVVEVMHDDKKGEHLRFHVHFWFGAAKEERDDKKDAFRVLIGEEALQQAIEDAESKTSVRSDRTVTQ